jgi:hypothetical protein
VFAGAAAETVSDFVAPSLWFVFHQYVPPPAPRSTTAATAIIHVRPELESCFAEASAPDENIGLPTTASEAIWLDVSSTFRVSIEDEDADLRFTLTELIAEAFAGTCVAGYPMESAVARGSGEEPVSRETATGMDFDFVGFNDLLPARGKLSEMEGLGAGGATTASFTDFTSCTGSIFLIGLAGSMGDAHAAAMARFSS